MSSIRPVAALLLLLFTKNLLSQTNIALNKTASCSSIETNTQYNAASAVDGKGTGSQINTSGSCSGTCTRWSSGFSNPQWLCVNLGGFYNINNVKLYWEVANGKDFTIQTSLDSLNWTTVQSVTGNTAFSNSYTITSILARYVRMYGTARNTAYGFSVWEMEVYGSFVVLPIRISDFIATAGKDQTNLFWKTYSDGPATFAIERSNNGNSFSAIGNYVVKALGSSTTTCQFTDKNPAKGNNLYRLAYSENGSNKTIYSEIISINTMGLKSFSVYPNPIKTDKINIHLSQPYTGIVKATLRNTTGTVVSTETVQLANTVQFTVNVKRPLASGIYWLDVVEKEGILHQQIMIQ